ncbi:MAG: two pore domain potassium channel family protein [Betaproteobacteria bacterium]|nr:two pore domain potassium channel family protein [Betaproteobacteria bacterium]
MATRQTSHSYAQSGGRPSEQAARQERDDGRGRNVGARIVDWFGMGGVAPDDPERAWQWERRLHWVMIGVALLSIPAFYLEEFATARPLRTLGSLIEGFILAAFAAEMAWMLHVVRFRRKYLLRNWLDVMIIAFCAASLVGFESEWIALVRLLRLALVGMLLARAAGASRRLFRPGGLPYLLAFGLLALLAAGLGFYWLEPTVHSVSEGLWLAFVTGATVGYGDFVPTTPGARLFAVFIVIIGVATISLVTANVAALVIGEDETRLRHEMHEDIRRMRRELAQILTEEERTLVRELHRDVRELRAEMARLREEVRAYRHER